MRKKLLFTAMTLAAGWSLHAANIAWVSLHPADDTPSAAAAGAGLTNAPDVGYTKLLAANGHNVTRFLSVNDIDLNPDIQAGIATNDLVIISRSVSSAHYQAATETAVWNGFTAPVMVVGAYAIRSGYLGFTTGTTMADVGTYPLRLQIRAPGHPIFKDIAVSNNVMVNPYAAQVTYTNPATGATTLQNGISINNNSLPAGGILLASVASPSTPSGGMVIAEYPENMVLNGRDTLPSKRLAFLTGSRESGITGDAAGMFDLQPDGQKMFLAAVSYLLNPIAPTFLYPLASGTNLIANDTWTLNPGGIGSSPVTYQWYKNSQALPGATDGSLTFPALVPGDAGSYYVVAANSLGKATSTVATLSIKSYTAPASITNGIIAYWPLESIVGGKTPDLVSSYDMNAYNMGPANITPGKWGNAFAFTNGTQTLLSRINNPGEDLPIYSKSNFSLAFWVKGGGQADHRVFAEAHTTNNSPMFDLGTHNAGTDGSVDIYIRTLGGAISPDHAHSMGGQAFDDNWHHVAWVQRDVGGGVQRAQLFIDGILDPVSTTFAPIKPIVFNTTSIGGLQRAAASAWFTGLIDDVAVWDRDLSPAEIQILQVTSITNAPSRLAPLNVAKFRADLPAVVKGDSTTLRWDVNKDATKVTIDQGIGDVTATTTSGVGSTTITLDSTKTFVLTVMRGTETLTATTTVAAVEGVAPNWSLLDNFDTYTPGRLSSYKYWTDARGDSARFLTVNGNTALRTDTGNSVVFLPLNSLTVTEGQARTLFFRMILTNSAATAITNMVGLTDKGQRDFGDALVNIGPMVYMATLTNVDYGIDTNAWYIGARNGGTGGNTSNPIEFPPPPLLTNLVYNVWIDVTNNAMADRAPDLFTVYVAREGTAARTAVFQGYNSDRDFDYADAVVGAMGPDLNKLVLTGDNANHDIVVDDFYLSKNGINTTVPTPYVTGPVGPLPPLTVTWSGTQLQIGWTAGVLQQSADLNSWTDVPGATAPSYKVTPGGTAMFYRAR